MASLYLVANLTGTEVRALWPDSSRSLSQLQSSFKTTFCISAAEQHNHKARQKDMLLHSTLYSCWLWAGWATPAGSRPWTWLWGPSPGNPPAVPCTFLVTEEGNQMHLHGLVALTAMSLDTHPTHCPGSPCRGPGVISSRAAGTRLSPAWSHREHN